jgi:hypothetical protein
LEQKLLLYPFHIFKIYTRNQREARTFYAQEAAELKQNAFTPRPGLTYLIDKNTSGRVILIRRLRSYFPLIIKGVCKHQTGLFVHWQTIRAFQGLH